MLFNLLSILAAGNITGFSGLPPYPGPLVKILCLNYLAFMLLWNYGMIRWVLSSEIRSFKPISESLEP